jgi:hypothetical protein
MKPISRGHYALSACAAVAVLSGCGGATQFQNPTTSPSIAGSYRPDSGSGKVERLRARRIHPGEGGGDGIVTWFSFLARGRAEGPYPGTFTAHCHLEIIDYQGRWSWNFTEHFTIRSGNSKINGTIDAGGSGPGMPLPGVYQYATTNGYSGIVNIQSLAAYGGRDAGFREAFDGM